MTAGFLDPSPALSGAELTPEEQRLVDKIDGIKSEGDLGKVAVAIGLAFMLYHRYMSRQIKAKMKDEEPGNLILVAGATYNAFVPKWVQLVAPHLVVGYLEGRNAVDVGDVPTDALVDIAEGYAAKLGEHINDVSIEAMANGYQAQLNRKVPAQRAIGNVAGAYGVPIRTMNSLVTVWTGEDPKILSAVPISSARDAKAAAIIDKAMANRANTIGDVESWTARTTGKQLVWTYALRKGIIPQTATKIWRTARDERVCPVCGPLHKAEVPVEEQFVTDSGSYWTPPLHPRCRCDVYLGIDVMAEFEVKDGELVGKSFGKDPFDRDRHGRFSAREQRQPRPQTARAMPAAAPEKSKMASAMEAAKKKQAEAGPIKLNTIKVGTKVAGTKLTKVTLGTPEPTKVEQKQVQLGSPEIAARNRVALGPRKLVIDGRISALRVRADKPTDPTSKWFPLPEPLFSIVATRHGDSEHYYTDKTTKFESRDTIEHALSEHWDDVITQEAEDFEKTERGPQGPKTTYVIGTESFYINPEDYQGLLWWALNGGYHEEIELQAVDMYTEQKRSITVPAETLVRYMNINKFISDNTPVVIITSLGSPETEITGSKSHFSAVNPGEWVTANTPSGSEWIKDINVRAKFRFAEPLDLKDTRH